MRKNVGRGAAAALSGVLMASTAAKADDLNVYDTHGTLIGVWFQIDNLRRQFKDDSWHVLGFHREGLEPNALFFYSAANCSGQRYIYDTDFLGLTSLVNIAYYDGDGSPGTPTSGGVIWGIPANVEAISVSPRSYFSYQYDPATKKMVGSCNAWAAGGTYDLYPAAALDTTSKGFSPPFCVSTTPVRCK